LHFILILTNLGGNKVLILDFLLEIEESGA